MHSNCSNAYAYALTLYSNGKHNFYLCKSEKSTHRSQIPNRIVHTMFSIEILCFISEWMVSIYLITNMYNCRCHQLQQCRFLFYFKHCEVWIHSILTQSIQFSGNWCFINMRFTKFWKNILFLQRKQTSEVISVLLHCQPNEYKCEFVLQTFSFENICMEHGHCKCIYFICKSGTQTHNSMQNIPRFRMNRVFFSLVFGTWASRKVLQLNFVCCNRN